MTPSRFLFSFADTPFPFLSSCCSCAVELSSNYLMDNNTRRTLIPPFLPTTLMTSRYYPSFALLIRAPHPVMTVYTNTCLKLGLLHHLFPFLCHARKRTPCVVGASRIYHYSTDVAVNLSRTRCTFRFPRIFCDRLTLARALACCPYYLLALHIVQAHICICMCSI